MKALKILLLCLLPLLASCGMGTDLAGSGSSSPNALTGTVLCHPSGDSAARLAVGASVSLYRIEDTTLSDGSLESRGLLAASAITDNNGNFSIAGIPSGHYSMVYAFENEKRFSGYFQYKISDTLNSLGYVVLGVTQNISGIIRDTVDTASALLVLDLVGTPFTDTVGPGGAFAFNALPLGRYGLNIRKIIANGIIDSVRVTNTVLVCDTLRPVYSTVKVEQPTSAAVNWNNSIATDSFPLFPYWGTTIVHLDSVSTVPAGYQINYTQEANK